MARQISVVAVGECSGTGIMGVIDIFKVANRIAARINETDEPLFTTRLISAEGESIKCSNGYEMSVDGGLTDIEPDDILFIVAFNIGTRADLTNVAASWPKVLPWFREHGPKQSLILTSCSGSFLLAEAGLLDGKQATTAWWLLNYMEEMYPQVKVDREAICIESGNIICGAGTSSYQDVCLAVIERVAGKHFAQLTAKYLMVDNQRRSQAPYTILSLIETNDDVVNRAEQWIRANIASDFKIEEVAREAAVSSRTLIRRFQKALGETPQAFTQKVRIEKCKTLLETTQLRFEEIVERCGYNDESAFRRLFKRHCQLSPRDYRRRFNTATVVV